MGICLLDISGLMYRAFYGTPSMKYNDSEVGALFGFCSEIINLISIFNNSSFVAALDCSRKTFRTDIYPEYKANRENMPIELLSQCSLIHEACEQFGFKIIKKSGYEADDIIATCTQQFCGCNTVTVISGDKDLLQLLQYDNVKVYNPSKHQYITEQDVLNKFGVTPNQLLDLFALMGDTSDNVPGIPGVGFKTASRLISQYQTLECIVNNLNLLPNTKIMQKVRENIDKAVLSKKLIELCYSVDLNCDLNNDHNSNDIIGFLSKYNFRSLVKRLKQKRIV